MCLGEGGGYTRHARHRLHTRTGRHNVDQKIMSENIWHIWFLNMSLLYNCISNK